MEIIGYDGDTDIMSIGGTMKKLGFGLMRLPLTDAKDFGSVDQKAFNKMADAFYRKGLYLF